MLIISPTDTDHLRLIGDISSAEESAFKSAINQWPHGCKTEGYQHDLEQLEPNQKCYFVDFNGAPWGAYNKNERLHGRIVMQTLINNLKAIGWSLLISADVSAKCVENKDAHYSIDCHSIFLIKTTDPFFSANMTFDMPSPPSYLEALYGDTVKLL